MLTKRVHSYVVHPVTGAAQLTEVRPYIRLSQKDAGTVFLQEGACFADAGEEIELPEWAMGMLDKLTPRARREVKWEAEPLPEAIEAAKPAMFLCPDCDTEIEMTKKGVHIAAHRRAAKKGE